jgi:hypothetical protein
MSQSRAWALALGLAASACAPARGVDTPQAQPAQPAQAWSVAWRVPRDAVAFVASPDLQAFSLALGKRSLEAKLRAEYEELSYELVRETGHNLLDLGELARCGVDVHGPAGLAWLASDQAWLGFVTLRDAARFKTELYRLEDARPEVVRDTVLAVVDDAAVLVDDRTALLIVAEDAPMVARRIAELEPHEALAHHLPFRTAIAKAQAGAQLFAYADVRGLLYREAGMDPRWGGESIGEARRRLEVAHREALLRARVKGADTSEIVALDDRFRVQRAALRDDEPSRRMRGLAGTIEGAALSATLRDSGLSLRLDVELAKGSPLRRLLQRTTVPKLAVDADPSLVVAFALDPDALVELASLAGDVRAMLGVLELDPSALRALDGEGAVALWPRGRSQRAFADRQNLAGRARLGVRDPSALDRLLDALAKGTFNGVLSRQTGGRWTLRPRSGPPWHGTMKNGALAWTSDPRAAQKPSLPASLSRGPGALVSLPASASATLAPGDFWLAGIAHDLAAPAADPPDALEGATPEYRDKRKRLAAIDAEIARRMEHHLARRFEQARRLASALGRVGARVTLVPHGLELSLEYATAGGRPAALLADVRHFERELAEIGELEDEALEPLREERRRLDDELYELEKSGANRVKR